jgi:lipopolysaccharide transport system ATP-binding protein
LKPILEIQNVSKIFGIQHEQQTHLNLRDSLMSLFKASTKTKEEFYALNNINFNVMPGDTIGIIGKNGAGKSTLLKILSKITPPTSGKIISRGRIASLLEVGTGFHSELSGRENIFLNGSILGMKRKEIQDKFDAIIDFSGTEKFLDTALKHYSSGMQLRLAFAVAAFLEPEILIIDEVLAVGDAEFQKKCMGKMEDVSKNGRTILFVSHNMASMKTLCQRGLLIEKGKLVHDGAMAKAVESYLSTANKTLVSGTIPANSSSINNGTVKFTKFMLLDKAGDMTETVNYFSPIKLYFELESNIDLSTSLIDIRIKTIDGIMAVHAMNSYNNSEKGALKKGLNIIHCKLQNQLQPGKYSFTIGVHKTDGTTIEFVEDILDFHVLNIAEEGNTDFIYSNYKLGLVRFESEWNIQKPEHA